MTVADSIMIAVGWGSKTYVGWVDKVAVMSDYFSVNSGHRKRQRFDGAALHIGNSTIPAEFWRKAPTVGTVIPPTLQGSAVRRNNIFVCPGFPGRQNDYADLAGLYIAGKHSRWGYGYGDFKPVALTVLPIVGNFEHKHPKEDKEEKETKEDEQAGYQGCLTWDNNECFVASGQSGSPCVVFVNGEAFVTASVNTDGVGAPFTFRVNGQFPVAMDPIGLLRAVGAPEEKLVKLLKPVPAEDEKPDDCKVG